MTLKELLKLSLEALEGAKVMCATLQEIGIRAGKSAKEVRMNEVLIHDRAIIAIREAIEKGLVDDAQPAQQYTYASTQATMCACCGKHKHTPLRIDAMGGYVCLTCIDQKLGSLLGEFGYPEPEIAEQLQAPTLMENRNENS